MEDTAKKLYTKGGWRFIECTLCGAKYNSGRPQNGAGIRYSDAEKANWWSEHTGIPQKDFAKLDVGDVPICPHKHAS